MATYRQKMVPWIILVLLNIQGCLSDLLITHAPSYVPFVKYDGDIKLSEVQEVISTALGYEINKDLAWEGLGQGSLFQRPKANVIFSLEGLPQEGLNIKHVARYSTDMDVAEVSTDGVVNNIQNAAFEEKPLLVDFSVETTVFGAKSHQPDLFENVPVSHEQLHKVFSTAQVNFSPADIGSLNHTQEPDLVFLGELHLVQELAKSLKANSKLLEGRLPNFFHFKVRGLRNLIQEYGQDSAKVVDAVKLLEQFIDKMTEEFRRIYDDNVVIEVVTLLNSEQLSRKSRSLLQDAPKSTAATVPNINLAEPYDEMFPVMFNIILWLMILLGLTVFGVSYGMWFMDPGRDSIIYRMTSQRIKKD